MTVIPYSEDALRLLTEGSIALAEVECNGMGIDEQALNQAITRTERRIFRYTEEIKQQEVYKQWSRKYGDRLNLNSPIQLSDILFNVMGYVPPKKLRAGTDDEKAATDEEALEEIDDPFVENYLRIRKLKKANNQYLHGIRRELVNGRIHCFFNLNTATSYRSSANSINTQNLPIRNTEIMELIRGCFIPSKGNQTVEIDFSGAEVVVGTCVTGDTQIETIEGPLTIVDLIDDVRQGKQRYVYGFDLAKSRVAVGKVTAGGKTGSKKLICEIVLDNGEVVRTTANHKFLMRDGQYRDAIQLRSGDSLMPLYKTTKLSSTKGGTKNRRVPYSKIYLNNGQSRLVHNLIAEDVFGVVIERSNKVVHHRDGNGINNSLDNLEVMTRSKHMKIHSVQGWINNRTGKRFWWHKSREGRAFAKRMNAERKKNWTEEDKKEHSRRVSEGMKRVGGNHGSRNPMWGKKHSPETIKRISKSRKGKGTGHIAWSRGLTKETHHSLMAASNKKSGLPAHNKGKKGPPVSKKTRHLLSLAGKGRKHTTESIEKCKIAKFAYWNKVHNEGKQVKCSICGKLFYSIGSHMRHKHNNHQVISVRMVGCEDVYNINVEGIHNFATSAGVIVKNCYHKDPVMMRYLTEEDADGKLVNDMHRDSAMELFKLPLEEVTKPIRQIAKNRFVFREFYGGYYLQCANDIWKDIRGVTIKSGKLLTEHLAEEGINEVGLLDSKQRPQPGTFEHQCQKAETDLWERFSGYAQWKRDEYDRYRRQGYIKSLTGFIYQGYMRRNEVLSYSIQGSSFHCLLWSLIQIVRKFLKKYKMKSMITGQIHDSIVCDVVPAELDNFLEMCQRIMVDLLGDHYPWLILPMKVEVDVCPVGEPWSSKQPYKLQKV